MDDLLPVGGSQRARDLADDGGDGNRLAGQGARAAQRGRQALAFQVLHDDVSLLVDDLAVVDLDDPGMLDDRRRARFVEEAGHHVRVLAQCGEQELDRGPPADAPVVGEIDLAHSALSELLDEGVAADSPTDHPKPPIIANLAAPGDLAVRTGQFSGASPTDPRARRLPPGRRTWRSDPRPWRVAPGSARPRPGRRRSSPRCAGAKSGYFDAADWQERRAPGAREARA